MAYAARPTGQVRSALIAVLAFAPFPARAAVPIHVSIEQRTLVVTQDEKPISRLMLPAEPRQILTRGAFTYVALGTAGLWVIDLTQPESPVVAARVEEGHDIVGVLAAPGTTVLVIQSPYSVLSYDMANPAAPALVAAIPTGPPAEPPPPPPPPRAPAMPQEPPAPPPAPEPISGRVLRIASGMALLDRGSADGLPVGAHVEIFSSRMVWRLSPRTGSVELAPSRESVGVLLVRVVDEHAATAEITRGTAIRVGDEFVVTDAPVTEHLIFPARQDYHHRIEAVLRPFVEINAVAVGFVNDFRYRYHFDAPFQVEVGVTPLAFEIRGGAGDEQVPTAFDFTALYDHDYFAIGLGVGSLVYGAESGSVGGPLTPASPAALRFGLYQTVRLGAVDGLMVELRNSFVFRERTIGDGSQMTFQWGSTEIQGNIPLHRRVSLLLDGGGGNNGWAYGEIGIRTFFSGSGGPGTIIVPIAAGVGSFTTIGATGPLVSIGIEWRN
jgi:hypothetical protein